MWVSFSHKRNQGRLEKRRFLGLGEGIYKMSLPESKEVSKTNQTKPNQTPLLTGYVDQHRANWKSFCWSKVAQLQQKIKNYYTLIWSITCSWVHIEFNKYMRRNRNLQCQSIQNNGYRHFTLKEVEHDSPSPRLGLAFKEWNTERGPHREHTQEDPDKLYLSRVHEANINSDPSECQWDHIM